MIAWGMLVMTGLVLWLSLLLLGLHRRNVAVLSQLAALLLEVEQRVIDLERLANGLANGLAPGEERVRR